jgi:hypothetical protein
VLHITGGGPRVVAPPWERERIEGSRKTFVGVEDYVRPDDGPLDLYLSAFPTRHVGWNRRRQMFEITDAAAPGWREIVCELAAPPDPVSGTPRSPEEVAALVESGSMDLRQVFRHFDYEFVNQRIREWFEFREDGPAKYTDRISARNRARTRRRHRAVAANTAAGLNEIRRYLPLLAGEGDKIPVVPVGISFSQ